MRKRRISSLFISLVVALAFFGALPFVVHAQSYGNDMATQLQAAAGNDGAGLGEPTDPRATVIFIIRFFLNIIGLLLLFLNLYAGFLWFTAGGNDEQVATAKTYLRNGIIGLIIILSSYSITIFAANLARGYTPATGILGSFI